VIRREPAHRAAVAPPLAVRVPANVASHGGLTSA